MANSLQQTPQSFHDSSPNLGEQRLWCFQRLGRVSTSERSAETLGGLPAVRENIDVPSCLNRHYAAPHRRGIRGWVTHYSAQTKKRPRNSVALFVENTGVELGVLTHPEGGVFTIHPNPSFGKEGLKEVTGWLESPPHRRGIRGWVTHYSAQTKKATEKFGRLVCGEYGSRTRDLLHAMQAL